ncbi:MAG: hypothetical protein EBS41_00275 [Actinobacteria bacterium]|jgi:hypothetical protein|nr:hypothetical protein [Actinomycetota bacterium]
MGVDEEFAQRGFAMSGQDINYRWWQKALGGVVGAGLGWDYLFSAWQGRLTREGFDLWLPYAAVAVGVFIFPRSIRFTMQLLAALSPVAIVISLIRDTLQAAIWAAAVGVGCYVVSRVIPWFRPEPFAYKWPEKSQVKDFLDDREPPQGQ